MNDLHGDTLRSALRSEADHLAVPPPPVHRLVSLGRSRVRTRRRRIAAGVVAGVAAVVVGGAVTAQPGLLGSDRPDGPAQGTRLPTPSPTSEAQVPPDSLDDLPQGEPPRLPYVQDGSIYTAAAITDLEIASPSVRVGGNGVTVVYGQPDEGGAPVYLFDPGTGTPIRLLTDAASGSPVVSADGRFVAWQTQPDDGDATVAAWNVGDQQPVANSVTFPFQPTCCDNPFLLVGIDGEGRVYGFGGRQTWMAWLSLEGQPEVIDGLGGGYVSAVGPDGLVVTVPPTSKEVDEPRLMVGRLDPDLNFRSHTTVEALRGALSPDGRLLAYLGDDHGVRMRDLGSGTEEPVLLPAGTSAGELIWESDTAVLVEVIEPSDDSVATWIRCDASDGRCETAATLSGDYRLPRSAMP